MIDLSFGREFSRQQFLCCDLHSLKNGRKQLKREQRKAYMMRDHVTTDSMRSNVTKRSMQQYQRSKTQPTSYLLQRRHYTMKKIVEKNKNVQRNTHKCFRKSWWIKTVFVREYAHSSVDVGRDLKANTAAKIFERIKTRNGLKCSIYCQRFQPIQSIHIEWVDLFLAAWWSKCASK